MEDKRRPIFPAPPVDIREKGSNDGFSDRRLYMQLLVWTGCDAVGPLIDDVEGTGLEAAIYENVNDPFGVGMVTVAEDPSVFTEKLRPVLQRGPFAKLSPKPGMTMLGRTYSLGYEPDLDETLLARPRRHVFHPDWSWAVWYPLRRSGAFQQLPAEDQRMILMEHGQIGRGFGEAGFAHDVRLACHGLDHNDNDFVIGLVGPELIGLSKIVETMRKTKQTSVYLEKLGPFFVGRKVWQSV